MVQLLFLLVTQIINSISFDQESKDLKDIEVNFFDWFRISLLLFEEDYKGLQQLKNSALF